MVILRLDDIAEQLAPLRPRTGPFIIGITGSVAVGKSTMAQALAEHLRDDGARVEVVGSDSFLFPNARLETLGLLNQKGAPATYDHAAMGAALTTVRTAPADFPTYSHVIYDIDPALTRKIAPPDVLILEGLALRDPRTGPPELLDALVYMEAAEADLERWYVARFIELWDAAEHDPRSFYARFRHMNREEIDAFARMVWREVNLKNLHEHIVHARPRSDLILAKAADHAIASVTRP